MRPRPELLAGLFISSISAEDLPISHHDLLCPFGSPRRFRPSQRSPVVLQSGGAILKKNAASCAVRMFTSGITITIRIRTQRKNDTCASVRTPADGSTTVHEARARAGDSCSTVDTFTVDFLHPKHK
jgi:hypothetical protein